MRRLAFLLFLGTSALGLGQAALSSGLRPASVSIAENEDSPAYLKLRAQHGIVQASVPSALREVFGTKVLELQGKITGSFQANASTVLLLLGSDGSTQEIEAKVVPAWLTDTEAPVRMLVRGERKAKGSPLRASLLAAAPEIDVLPTEEAYWRKLADERRATEAVPVQRRFSRASRHGTTRPTIYGTIGGRSYAAPRGVNWVLPADQVVQRYASFIRGRNPRLLPSQALRIAQAVVVLSQRYQIPDMRLVMAVLLVESGFNPNAVSRTGAIGLGQLMPGTARDLGVRNSYDSIDNLAGTIKLLSNHLSAYGAADVRGLSLALAAYNAGPGAVRRHGGVPPYRETQAYVRKVLAYYARMAS